MIVATRDDGIRIVRVTAEVNIAPFRASFAGAYQDIFSEPPYNERFFPSEAEAVFQRLVRAPDNITLVAVKGRSKVVAFGIGVPCTTKPAIARQLRGLVPVGHTFCLAELGVLQRYRGNGLGRQLTEMRLDLIDRNRFSHVVLRTSAVRDASYQMYMKMGFDDVGVYMEVTGRRVDGTVSTDRRLILHKVLPAPEGADSSVVPD